MGQGHRLRLAVNLLNGSTLAGILVATAGGARVRPAGEGLLAGSGYRLPLPAASAFCLGNVLVTRLGHAEFTGRRFVSCRCTPVFPSTIELSPPSNPPLWPFLQHRFHSDDRLRLDSFPGQLVIFCLLL